MADPCRGVHDLDTEVLASKTLKESAERIAAFPREALGQGVDGADAVKSAHATAEAAAAVFCAKRSCAEGMECGWTKIEYEKDPLYAGSGPLGATLILQVKSITCRCKKKVE